MAKQLKFIGNDMKDEQLGEWFKKQYASKLTSQKALDYINSLDNAELGALLNQNGYYDKDYLNISGPGLGAFDYGTALDELNALENVQDGPKLADFIGDYYGDAERAINKENEDILKMYDENLARNTDAYNSEMHNLNEGYNNYAKNVLGNQYQNNSSILGTYQSDMNRTRQNSLEAGANAGLRIAGNINTLLSAQNKQASTSLETSNQLAQAMLNQRNAAAGLRGNYTSMLNSDTQNRANLKSGTYERTQSAAGQNYNTARNRYNAANQVTAEQNGNYESNGFYDSYMKKRKANSF